MNNNLALPVSIILVFFLSIYLYLMTTPTQYPSSSEEETGLQQDIGLQKEWPTDAGDDRLTDNAEAPKLRKEDVLKLKTFRLANVDGQLAQDDEGNLVINRDLRHWIDFYLSATGEVSLNDLIALMKQEISLLDSPAKEQALDLLLSYLGYKTALADYDDREALSMSQMSTIEQVGDRLRWQKRLRREWLPTEATEQFWQLDEIIDDHAYQKLVIHSSDLSDEEKAQHVSVLENELPKEVTDFKKSLTLSKDLMAQEKELIAQGRGDEIAQLRAEKVSPEAVERLEVFDQKQAKWRSRVVDYRNQLQHIESLEGVSETHKKELIDEYQSIHFDERETLRLPAAVHLIDAE